MGESIDATRQFELRRAQAECAERDAAYKAMFDRLSDIQNEREARRVALEVLVYGRELTPEERR